MAKRMKLSPSFKENTIKKFEENSLIIKKALADRFKIPKSILKVYFFFYLFIFFFKEKEAIRKERSRKRC